MNFKAHCLQAERVKSFNFTELCLRMKAQNGDSDCSISLFPIVEMKLFLLLIFKVKLFVLLKMFKWNGLLHLEMLY